ncbi:biotin--[acetyl-CoA-carboxylase] ligase [Methylobacterium goesingense]|uniref:biotin--[acetyl-CoA-carboxylase] ligase n=1 Tax=Methylobacterium goesingense TaxID=243690 RepID=UPI001EE25B22|nr:biotin--[acetyl-CoA-carboxylase] ligase [Methylobacterium goesingense]GJD75188.1 Bifunctional ligase/repressor BirA [Methylobacterium goesingense]
MDGYGLGSLARGEGHRLHVQDRLGSTNTEALDLFRAGETGPLWIVARRQEAGRGRRGNAWLSETGNLTASLLWPVDAVDPAQVPTLGFVAGVALVAALKRATASGSASPAGPACESPFRLKWPNDVLASDAKLAGLLLEAESRPHGGRAVVMGFGVNVAATPQGLPYRATCLRQMLYDTRAEDLFVQLTDTIVDAARLWDGGRGFSGIRERWIADAAGIGAPVSVRTGDTLVHGIFETIDEAGRLVVRSEDGTRRTVTAGEVHLGTAATAA